MAKLKESAFENYVDQQDYNYRYNDCIYDLIDVIGKEEALDAILKMIPLDSYAVNFMLMDITPGDEAPAIWDEYKAIASSDPNLQVKMLERYEFYDRASKAYAVIASGEERVYANIILFVIVPFIIICGLSGRYK